MSSAYIFPLHGHHRLRSMSSRRILRRVKHVGADLVPSREVECPHGPGQRLCLPILRDRHHLSQLGTDRPRCLPRGGILPIHRAQLVCTRSMQCRLLLPAVGRWAQQGDVAVPSRVFLSSQCFLPDCVRFRFVLPFDVGGRTHCLFCHRVVVGNWLHRKYLVFLARMYVVLFWMCACWGPLYP